MDHPAVPENYRHVFETSRVAQTASTWVAYLCSTDLNGRGFLDSPLLVLMQDLHQRLGCHVVCMHFWPATLVLSMYVAVKRVHVTEAEVWACS